MIDKKTEIFNSALKQFAKYGYKKTTVEDVALEIGMTKGNIYFYVKNKKDLYEKSIGHALESWRQLVEEDVKHEKNLIEKFKVMSFSSFKYINQNNDLQSIIQNDPGIFSLTQEEDRFNDINQKARGIIKSILSQGKKEKLFHITDINHVTELIFSIYIMFLIKAYIKSEKTSVEKMFDEGVNLIIRGLCNHPSNIK